jgi:PTH1 family peptidyl-tRNA hydrolase
MILIAGLGNPGPRYAGNRHNIGFMAAEAIARRHGLGPWRRRFQGETADGLIGEERAVVLKPLTYMNESGRSVGEAMRFFGLAPEDVVVLHDELDLPPGKVRVKSGGGHAGHNGLRSIHAHIGPEFHRVRLGIGHPGHKDLVQVYVLNDFAKADRDWLDALLDAVAEAAPDLARRQFASFQNKVHLALNPKSDPSPEKPPRLPGGEAKETS